MTGFNPTNSGYILEDDPAVPCTNATVPFRELIPHPDHPKVAGISTHNAQSWLESRKQIPTPSWLIEKLEAKNLERPYKGFTVDGNVIQEAYHYSEDEGAPIEEMTAAAESLLSILSPEQVSNVLKDSVDNDEFRLWANPVLYVNPGGLRLEECTPEVQVAVHNLLRASSSKDGYDKILGCTLTNAFLGYLVNGKGVLNAHSYNFRLFGKPHLTEPWGFTFFGHHLALATLIKGRCMVVGPTFMGAEPDRIDEGPHAGLRLFRNEEVEGLNLMRSLSPELQIQAQLSKGMGREDLPKGRWNAFDERHLGGARRDNYVVPYEGCPVSSFNPEQKAIVLRLFRHFNVYLPHGPLAARLKLLEQYMDQTYFAWIGGFGLGDPYYYRLHSPVTFCEFDFHCGIFLTNTSPAKCHIHTINRLPNAGDYGKALLRRVRSS